MALPMAIDAGVPPVVPGFPNVPQTPGTLLSGLNAPQQGRTAIIAYHNGVLFTVPEVPSSQPGADFLVRTWDLADPTAPVELTDYGITPMPINAHGYLKSGEYLVLGANWPPEAPWSFRATVPGEVERTEFPDLLCAGVRGCLFQPWFVGDTYWSYNEVGGDASIQLDGNVLATWDHLGATGVIGHPFLIGDLLIFASDQSRTGVATYDVSDPTNPVLLDVLTTGGAGGYWPELWGGDGKLYVVFPYRSNGNGFRVVDVSDPSDLRFLIDRPLPGDESMYIQFQDEFAFMGGHKVDMRDFESVLFLDGANAVRPNDGGVGVNTSQFLLPLGNLLISGGIGSNEGMAIWAHQAAPDLRGPAVGFHIPQAGRTGYPVGAPITLLIHETLESFTIVNGETFIVRPLGGAALNGRLTFSFDDVLTFTPDQPLATDSTYEVVLPAGGIKDAAGNGMEGYSFTFATGPSVGGNQPPQVESFTASDYPIAPGAAMTLFATAGDADGDPIEFRFDFGDGTPKTAWSSSGSASHSYPESRHYRASVQVRDTAGSIATESSTVTVLLPPPGPAPPRSSPLLCDDSSRRIWAVNPDNGTLTAVDADSRLKLFEVAVCEDPRAVAMSAVGELWVSCHDEDLLRLIDAGSGAVVGEVATGYGSAPLGVAASPSGDRIYVAMSGGGELRVFDAASRSELGAVALGPTPRAVAVTPDGGRILVTRFVSPRNHAEVWDVDAASLTLSRTLNIPKFGNEENRDTTASGRGVANYLTAITISPSGTRAWLTANKPNSERGLFFAQDLDEDNTVRNVLIELDLVANEFSTAIDLDNSDSAHSVAYSPLGDYLFVGLQGNGEMVVLDALLIDSTSGLGSLVTRLGTGLAPQGLCSDAVTGRVWAKNFMSRDLTIFEADPLYQTGSINLETDTTSTVATEVLAPSVLLGKQIFYHATDPRMSSEGYLSCASCHLDGGHDGRVWDFTGRGEGFRNTVTLRGRAGMEHGNVHWSANFDEIQDFENDIRGAFGGAGFMSDADFEATSDPLGPPKTGLSAELDALADYVASLGRQTVPRSPYRTTAGALTAEGQSGSLIFDALACGACHTAPDFTDSTQGAETLHDVGTLRTSSGQRLGGPLTGIDTPTLLGAWNSAPYFHDGSAPTLDTVFEVAGGDILQAENGTRSNGAQLVDQYVDLNNDDTLHASAYVALPNTGATLTLNGVDGGSGGLGALEIRYSTGGSDVLGVTVNGSAQSINLSGVGNDPAWRHTNWEQLRIENITLTAGATNTIELAALDAFPNTSLDDVLVSTADDLAAAEPHRRALALSSGDRAALISFLRQIDSQGASTPVVSIFADGFESGDVSAWSSVVP